MHRLKYVIHILYTIYIYYTLYTASVDTAGHDRVNLFPHARTHSLPHLPAHFVQRFLLVDYLRPYPSYPSTSTMSDARLRRIQKEIAGRSHAQSEAVSRPRLSGL